MAFNPFTRFRKHQKVIFAVLTIAIMFVFVLSTGTSGDFFSQAAGWFGGGKQKGQLVATLHGKKFYEGDLDSGLPNSLRTQRQMASSFVVSLMHHTVQSVIQDAMGGKAEKVDRRLVEVLSHMQLRMQGDRQFQFQTQQDLQIVQMLKEELKNKAGKEDDLKFLNEIEAALKVQEKLVFLPFMGGEMGYFGHVERRDEGRASQIGNLLDFQLWKMQADKLGIVLNKDEVRKMLKTETGGLDMLPEGAFKTNEKYKSSMGFFDGRFGNFTEDQILTAVGEEYRVVLAQESLLGQALNYRGGSDSFMGGRSDKVAVTVTPGEFLTYYRDQRTSANAAFLPLHVEEFEKKIKDEPSEAVLRKIYSDYKNEEASAERALPGFKTPRKLRVEYFHVSPEQEQYKNLAKAAIPSNVAAHLSLTIAEDILSGANTYAAGGGAAWPAVIRQPMEFVPVAGSHPYLVQTGAKTAALGIAGSWQRSIRPAYGRSRLARPAVIADPLWSELLAYHKNLEDGATSGHNARPETYTPSYEAASTLGLVLSGVASGNLAAAPAAIHATNVELAKQQARGLGASILVGTAPTPLSAVALHTATYKVEPLDKIEAMLVEKARKNYAKQAVQLKLSELFVKLMDLNSKPAEAEKLLETSIKNLGGTRKSMPEAKPINDLGTDETLAELREALMKVEGAGISKPEQFTQLLASPRFAGIYRPVPFEAKERTFVFWTREDKPATVRTFSEARDDVLQAWKRMQARTLARKEAKRIETAAEKKDWPTDSTRRESEVLAFLNEQQQGKPFTLNKIARQVEADSANPGLSKQYQAYTPPEDKIKYPPQDLADRVLKLEKPGEANYLEDRPEKTLYVIVLLDRTPPSMQDFAQTIQSFSKPLWDEYVTKQRAEYRTKYLEKMREDAAPGQTDKGKWKLPEFLTSKGGKGTPLEDSE